MNIFYRYFGVLSLCCFPFFAIIVHGAEKGETTAKTSSHAPSEHPPHDHQHHDHIKKLDEGMQRRRDGKKVSKLA